MDTDATMQDAQPAAAATPKKRPRLEMTIEPRERKRGKSMFGLLVGTLNKAKTEDEARNASEAVRGYTWTHGHRYLTLLQAKKRQLIDKRLQDRLRKETDTVRRAEEAKKDKHTANRKEEEIQLKNSIVGHLRTRLNVNRLNLPGIFTSIDFVVRDFRPSPTFCSRQTSSPLTIQALHLRKNGPLNRCGHTLHRFTTSQQS